MQKKSIYEIAKQTGVSPTTVSRVLNNHPNVSATTRQTVLKAINGANYVPTISKSAFENPAGSRLRGVPLCTGAV